MKITKLLLSICFLVAMMVFAGCQPDNPPDDPKKPPVVVDMLDVSLDTILFTADKDASLIVVETNAAWSVTKTADWISLSATSGNQNTGFLIGASPNTSFYRETSISIKAGDITKHIKIIQAGAPKIVFSVNDVSFYMVLVEGGEFTMGGGDNSGISHRVKLSDYYISETEVTNELWYAVRNSLPYSQDSEENEEPVSQTTWNDISTEFIPAINKASGKTFRLPTEAEWEYAAMGGKKSKGYKYSGSDNLDDVAWYDDNSYNGSFYSKQKVKQKAPNELGIYDMSGNVSEWCNDWYSAGWGFEVKEGMLDIPDLQTNPAGPATGTQKVVRGGSYTDGNGWGTSPCEVKYRQSIHPTGYDNDNSEWFLSSSTGFRLVITNN